MVRECLGEKTLAFGIIFGPFLWIISLFLILYTYLGYPFLLFFFSLKGKASSAPAEERGEIRSGWPAVSIIISAYNEEGVIEEKLKNTLELDYPAGKREIIVASDGSTDRTNQVAALYQDGGVRLLWHKERQGKSALLNQAVPQTNGEIIVFTDANALLDRGTLQNLIRHFQDERVGFVTGRTRYTTGSSVEDTTGMYNRYERYLKKKESMLGSCVGADGAIFAIRKNLWFPLRPCDLNDLTVPLKVIQQGYRGIMEESAVAREDASPEMEGEIHRQIRITNRTLRALLRNRGLLNPFRNPLFAWQLFSHKLLRLMVPFLMMTLFVSNLIMLGIGSGRPYFYFFCLQLAFYCLALIGSLVEEKEGKFSPISRIPYHFMLINWAMFRGWLRCFSRNRDVFWTPDRVVNR